MTSNDKETTSNKKPEIDLSPITLELGLSSKSSLVDYRKKLSDKPDENIYLTFLCAMRVEAQPLIDALEDKEKIDLLGYEIYKGKLYEKNILVCITGVGVIYTGGAIMVLVNNFKISYMVNYGIVGGYGHDIHKGNIIVVEESINLSCYESKKAPKGAGINLDNYEYKTFNEEGIWRMIIYKTNKDIINMIKNIKYDKNKIFYGRVGTCEAWNKEYDRIIFLNEKMKILAEEMEVVAMYQLCEKLKINAFSIKMVSNNEILNEEFDFSTVKDLNDYMKEVIKAID